MAALAFGEWERMGAIARRRLIFTCILKLRKNRFWETRKAVKFARIRTAVIAFAMATHRIIPKITATLIRWNLWQRNVNFKN